jgi:phosphoglycolate phosphatase-like HAD superfamily hydrolase
VNFADAWTTSADVENTAAEANAATITVVTGGFSEQELTDAGAIAVFESVAELCEHLDETGL